MICFTLFNDFLMSCQGKFAHKVVLLKNMAWFFGIIIWFGWKYQKTYSRSSNFLKNLENVEKKWSLKKHNNDPVLINTIAKKEVVNLQLQWLWMMSNDCEWCLMTVDDGQWWWIVLNDSEWCPTMVDDGKWCIMMYNDVQLCIMMCNDV